MTLRRENEPVFQLYVDGACCRFEVRLNDVPVFTDQLGLPWDAEIPVSEWMVSGTNLLSALVLPPAVVSNGEERFAEEEFDREESWLKLTLYVKKNGAERSARKKVTTLNFVAADIQPPQRGFESSAEPGVFDSENGFAPDQKGDVTVSPCSLEPYAPDGPDADELTSPPGAVRISREITLPTPHPPWLWLDGDPIEETDEVVEALFEEYQRLWGLLAGGDTEAVEAVLQPKAKEYAVAYYLQAEDEIRDLLSVSHLITSEELTLQPLYEEVLLQVFAGGRLARLIDEDGDSPVVFVNQDDIAYYVYLTYCRVGDEWVLIR